MASLEELTVIVPVAENDEAWKGLIPDLRLLPLKAEVLFVCPRLQPNAPILIAAQFDSGRRVRWIVAGPGRAKQLNAGAREAKGSVLWFLHADSRLRDGGLIALERALAARSRALHYFDLAFAGDGPALMRVNEWGARFRSRALRLPFGDQGFCLARDLFEQLGGFPEDAAYGEDHLFVWKAHQSGVPVLSTGAALETSARKYRDRGWLSTTARHLVLTARQALPEVARLMRRSVR